jgi:hypothetical protein
MKFPPPGVGWGTAYKSQPAQLNYRGRVALRLPSMKAGCSLVGRLPDRALPLSVF